MSTQLPIKKTPAAKAPVAPKKIVVKKVVVKETVVAKPKAIALVVPSSTPVLLKATPVKAVKPTKPAKPKLIRDSFTIPKDEYQVLTDLKARMTQLMQPAKKSELLRAGLKALAMMPDAVIKKTLLAVPSIKTGRPAKIIKK